MVDYKAFCHMRRGKQCFPLAQDETSLLSPIDYHNGDYKRALLLLHGFSSSPAVYREFLPFFKTLYDAVICPPLPGHGQNLSDFAKVKAKDWLLFAEQTCKPLIREYQQVDVMGLSLGGLLACHLSNQFTLHHLYLLAPSLDLPRPLRKYLRLAKLLKLIGLQSIRSNGGSLYTDLNFEIAFRRLPITTIIEMLQLIKQFSFVLPRCPTDLFLGCHDKVVSCERVAARFETKGNNTIHWLANSAHVIPLDGDINYLLDCVKQNATSENKSLASPQKASVLNN